VVFRTKIQEVKLKPVGAITEKISFFFLKVRRARILIQTGSESAKNEGGYTVMP
jgi:hypothetical protein